MFHRYGTYPLDLILPLIKRYDKRPGSGGAGGIAYLPIAADKWLFARVPVATKRLLVFRTKGTDCVACWLKGTEFALESHIDPNGELLRPHLNLYANDVLMTVDHTVALADGGSKEMSNLQPMCQPCNQAKGSLKELAVKLMRGQI